MATFKAPEVIQFRVRTPAFADVGAAVSAFGRVRQAIRNARRGRVWRAMEALGHLTVAACDHGYAAELRAVAWLTAPHQDVRGDLTAIFSVVQVEPLASTRDQLADELGRQLQPPELKAAVAAEFYSALYRIGGGFRPLRFTHGIKAASHRLEPCGEEIDPLPVLFGWT